jgi:hypothetical protein
MTDRTTIENDPRYKSFCLTSITAWKNSDQVRRLFENNSPAFHLWGEEAIKLKGFEAAETAVKALAFETPQAAAAIKAEVDWKTNAAIREEFLGNYDAYLGYCKGTATGSVRVLRRRALKQ